MNAAQSQDKYDRKSSAWIQTAKHSESRQVVTVTVIKIKINSYNNHKLCGQEVPGRRADQADYTQRPQSARPD